MIATIRMIHLACTDFRRTNFEDVQAALDVMRTKEDGTPSRPTCILTVNFHSLEVFAAAGQQAMFHGRNRLSEPLLRQVRLLSRAALVAHP